MHRKAARSLAPFQSLAAPNVILYTLALTTGPPHSSARPYCDPGSARARAVPWKSASGQPLEKKLTIFHRADQGGWTGPQLNTTLV
jgi:hypothetical protein